jgi:D-beta-D-heptose 7-phosphate kinase/D-beta-D-heptose 1-phosphate adenosyltransferase
VRTAASKIGRIEDVAPHAAAVRAAGQRVALASGAFDLMHAAHARFLQAARREAGLLVVAVTSEPALVPESDRALLVAALRAVDHVVVVPAQDVEEVARRLGANAHYRSTGGDSRKLLEKIRP